MRRSYLYITLLLTALTPGFYKIGKGYVHPGLNLSDSLVQHQDILSSGGREWWQIYIDSTLRSPINRAPEHNKDMLIAAVHVKEMATQKRISTANLLPDIKGAMTAEWEDENHGGDAFKYSDIFEA